MRCYLNTNLLTIFSIILAAGIAGAQQMPSSPVAVASTETSGMIGITAGQTARLNSLNPGVPAPFATGALCYVQVSFQDDQGNVLKTAQVTVAPGKSMPVDLPMANPGRTEIRAIITFTQPTPLANPTAVPTSRAALAMPFVCPLVPTLEIFDTTTSATLAVLTEFHFTYPFIGGLMGGSIAPR